MGTSRSVGEFAGKIGRMAQELETNDKAKHKLGQTGKAIFAGAKKAKGVDGTTPVSSKVRERYDPMRTGNGVLIRYTGPAHLINNKTAPHFIVPKSLGGSRRRRQQGANIVAGLLGITGQTFGGGGALKIDGDFAGYARHPGTKGLQFFADAKKASERVLPDVARKAVLTEPLRQIFR